MKVKNQKEIFKFYRYKKKQGKDAKKHPKLIVDYSNGEYGHMGLTEQKNKGKKHRNIPLTQNPKQGDMRPAYLRKKIEYDSGVNFNDNALNDYNLNLKDKQYLIEYVKKHKRK